MVYFPVKHSCLYNKICYFFILFLSLFNRNNIDIDFNINFMYLLLKNWWSKLSRRFRNLNVGRTFKAQSSSKIHVLSKSYDNLNEEESSDSQFSEISSSNDSGVTLRSLTSGMLELSIAISLETMRTRN